MRGVIVVGGLVGVLASADAAADSAAAEDDAFERKARNVFVFEGIAGVATHTREYINSNTQPQTVTQVGGLGMVPFSRLGYHRFLPHAISLGLGGQLVATRLSPWFDRPTTIFGLTPRVGWSTPISHAVSVWLRAGPGLVYLKSEGAATGQLSLGGEAILVIIPAHDFGITLAIFYERGIAGREVIESTNTSFPVRYSSLGLGLGLAIAF